MTSPAKCRHLKADPPLSVHQPQPLCSPPSVFATEPTEGAKSSPRKATGCAARGTGQARRPRRTERLLAPLARSLPRAVGVDPADAVREKQARFRPAHPRELLRPDSCSTGVTNPICPQRCVPIDPGLAVEQGSGWQPSLSGKCRIKGKPCPEGSSTYWTLAPQATDRTPTAAQIGWQSRLPLTQRSQPVAAPCSYHKALIASMAP